MPQMESSKRELFPSGGELKSWQTVSSSSNNNSKWDFEGSRIINSKQLASFIEKVSTHSTTCHQQGKITLIALVRETVKGWHLFLLPSVAVVTLRLYSQPRQR